MVRVVVTGVGADGVSTIEHDGPAQAAVELGESGLKFTYPWQVALPPNTAGDGGAPVGRVGSFLPPPGSLSFLQFAFPGVGPAGPSEAQLQAVRDEIRDKLPGLLPTLEPAKGPGMH